MFCPYFGCPAVKGVPSFPRLQLGERKPFFLPASRGLVATTREHDESFARSSIVTSAEVREKMSYSRHVVSKRTPLRVFWRMRWQK